MEYTNTIVRNGQTITLTDDEVENIYRFQERRYRLKDARAHVNDYILQYTNRDDDPWNMDITTVTKKDARKKLSKKQKKEFAILLAITDDDLEYLADEFECRFDCNDGENTTWENIIEDYLEDALEQA